MDTFDKILLGRDTLFRYGQEARSILMHPETWMQFRNDRFSKRQEDFFLSNEKSVFRGMTILCSTDVPVGDVHVLPNYVK